VRDEATEDNGRLLVSLPALLIKLLTPEGRSLYQEGVLPAEKSLAREDATAGLVSAVRRVEGTAVASTENTESSVAGRSMLRPPRSDERDALRKGY
jgi:hypothetical protein